MLMRGAGRLRIGLAAKRPANSARGLPLLPASANARVKDARDSGGGEWDRRLPRTPGDVAGLVEAIQTQITDPVCPNVEVESWTDIAKRLDTFLVQTDVD